MLMMTLPSGCGNAAMHKTQVEAPACENVKIHNICTVMITGNPGISHIINDSGDVVMTAGAREVICEFANGEIVR